jgi:hypothetical protein
MKIKVKTFGALAALSFAARHLPQRRHDLPNTTIPKRRKSPLRHSVFMVNWVSADIWI